jgi:hypothetical protein
MGVQCENSSFRIARLRALGKSNSTKSEPSAGKSAATSGEGVFFAGFELFVFAVFDLAVFDLVFFEFAGDGTTAAAGFGLLPNSDFRMFMFR